MSKAVAESSIAGFCPEVATRPTRFSLANVWGRYRLLFAVLLIAAIWLARSPYSASNLEVPPDSVEYALSAAQFLETGHYQIIVEGRGLPPRYPPWFPLTVILPVYALFGAEPGNAILGITAFAVAGVGISWAIGRRIGGDAGALFAALAVLALPAYAGWATQVMSDVPCTALILATALLFLRIQARVESAQLLLFWSAGALVAIATLFRPVSAAMLLPLLFAAVVPWHPGRALARVSGLLVPMAGAAAATFSYNAATFGSPLRNGYHFWSWSESPPLSDFFAFASIGPNLKMLFGTGLPLLLAICLGAEFLLRRRSSPQRAGAAPPLRHLIFFLVASGTPMLVFHLFYSYPADRFFLPVVTGVAVIAGSLLGLLISKRGERVLGWSSGVLLLGAMVARLAIEDPVPQRRVAADRVRANTPNDAVVISAIDPVYLEQRVARHSARLILPISREVEYTRAVLTPDKAIAAGGPRPHYIVKFVATERIDELTAQARRGRRLFLDASALEPADNAAFSRLSARFRMLQRAPALYELVPL